MVNRHFYSEEAQRDLRLYTKAFGDTLYMLLEGEVDGDVQSVAMDLNDEILAEWAEMRLDGMSGEDIIETHKDILEDFWVQELKSYNDENLKQNSLFKNEMGIDLEEETKIENTDAFDALKDILG